MDGLAAGRRGECIAACADGVVRLDADGVVVATAPGGPERTVSTTWPQRGLLDGRSDGSLSFYPLAAR